METAQERSWMRARLLKEQTVLKAWLEAGLRAWLIAPTTEGGMGFDAARSEAAIRKWHGREEEPKEEIRG